MVWLIRRCPSCRTYTLKRSCPRCGTETVRAHPARFSPEDRFVAYRAMLRRMAEEARQAQ